MRDLMDQGSVLLAEATLGLGSTCTVVYSRGGTYEGGFQAYYYTE